MSRSHVTARGSPDSAVPGLAVPRQAVPAHVPHARIWHRRRRRRQPRDRSRSRGAAEVTAFLIDEIVPAAAAILPRQTPILDPCPPRTPEQHPAWCTRRAARKAPGLRRESSPRPSPAQSASLSPTPPALPPPEERHPTLARTMPRSGCRGYLTDSHHSKIWSMTLVVTSHGSRPK